MGNEIFKNSYLRILAHSKLNFFYDLNKYRHLKNLNIFDEEKYLKVHPDCLEKNYDPIVHYIYFSHKFDNFETKRIYIDNIFDLDFYRYANNLKSGEDPLMHYITRGYKENCVINSFDEGFVKSLNTDLKKQWRKGLDNKIERKLKNNHFITDSSIIIPYSEAKKPFKLDTVKVGVFLEDNFENMNACPYLRLYAPLEELSKSGDYHIFMMGKELLPKLDFDKFMENKCFDVIILQRITSFYLDEIIEKAEKNNVKIIYETDDALLDIEPSNGAYIATREYFPKMEKAIENADEIVVSTPNLVQSFKDKGHDNIRLIRNYYAYNLLPIKKLHDTKSNTVTIGYFGTKSHDEDLEEILDIILELKEFLKKQGINLQFEIIGATALPVPDWVSTIKLPFYPMAMHTFMNWLSKTVNWDIGVTPLKKSKFNKSKSELKYLEFTALGVPVVASNFASYPDAIKNQINGYIADTKNEWFEYLKILSLDINLRRNIANKAREDMFENYNIHSRVKDWNESFKKVLSS